MATKNFLPNIFQCNFFIIVCQEIFFLLKPDGQVAKLRNCTVDQGKIIYVS